MSAQPFDPAQIMAQTMAQITEAKTKHLVSSRVDPTARTDVFAGSFEMALSAWQELVAQCPDRKEELGQWLRDKKEEKFKAHWEHWERSGLAPEDRSAMEKMLFELDNKLGVFWEGNDAASQTLATLSAVQDSSLGVDSSGASV